jgi:glyoxylase-like metal-dependent hydrolase (beta-lactamase superfamily II)
MTATNCWVAAVGQGEQCIIVDPGIGVMPQLNEIIAENALHPVAVFLSHGHMDHTFSVVPVCQARDVPAFIHADDRVQLTDPWSWTGFPRNGGGPFGGFEPAEPSDLRLVTDGEKISIAGMDFTVRHAPGHTLGSVTFDIADIDETGEHFLFSGDLLFAGSIGRVDLPGGSMAAMSESLKKVVLPMSDETIVLPGHGPTTTVGRERITNPFLLEVS